MGPAEAGGSHSTEYSQFEYTFTDALSLPRRSFGAAIVSGGLSRESVPYSCVVLLLLGLVVLSQRKPGWIETLLAIAHLIRHFFLWCARRCRVRT